jgi:hypothetical protein
VQLEQEAADLKSQINFLRTQHEATLYEVKQKEERIQHLLREIQNLVGITSITLYRIKCNLEVLNIHMQFLKAPLDNKSYQ